MKYLITGSTGYIGTQLIKRLVAEGNTVHALYRSESKAGELKALPNVILKKGDLLDKPSLRAAVEGCDAVFHVAAFAKPWDKDPRIFYHYNLDGAVNVFDAAQKAGIKRVVFTSTAGTMNPSEPGKPSKEDTARTVDFFTDYDRSKGQAEAVAKKMSANGMDIVTVNPSRVYGPGLLSDSNGVTRMVKMYLAGKFRLLPGDGTSIGNYVYIDDVVDGHLLAMQLGRGGERYIIGGSNASFNHFFETLSEITGLSHRMFRVPLPVMNFSAHFMEQRANLTGKPPIMTPPWVKRFNYNWELSVEKAKRELGYSPLSLQDGLMNTVSWLQKSA
jgi:nucleoside-diphosphate-sugar epimerase